jgi:hypothetical protein
LSLAAQVATALGDLSWWLHRATYGHQLVLLTILGVAVYGSRHFLSGLYVWALFTYTAFLYLLLLARLWWIRDDNGNWSRKHFSERFGAVLRDALGGLFTSGEFSLGTLLERMKLGLIAIGLALLVLVPPISALTYDVAGSVNLASESGDILRGLGQLETVGGYLLALGTLVWLFRRLRQTRPSEQAAEFKKSAEALTTRTDLPWYVDARDESTNGRELPRELQTLVSTLHRWRPRRSDESGYERSLVRFLERDLPGIKTRTQQPIQLEDGRRAELDVVVDDVLVIELKTDLRTASESDRAYGQLARYSASWKRGPVMLLVCEARFDFAEHMLVRRVGELRSLGRPVFVVAAGRRA